MPRCHSRASGNLLRLFFWIPAFAGMTALSLAADKTTPFPPKGAEPIPMVQYKMDQLKKVITADRNILWVLEGRTLDHGEIAVRFKTLVTEGDQVAGIVFHYKDPNTYNAIRAASGDETCVLLRVKDGETKVVDTQEVLVSPLTWHELRVSFTPKTYTALLDDQPVLGSDKVRYSKESGLIGLWTTGESRIQFDDLRVSR